TGFYLVPMFTLLQHRAPVDRKGEIIATSNFVNVVGAMISSLLFYFVVFAAHKTGLTPRIQPDDHSPVRSLVLLQYDEHHRPVYAIWEKEPGIGKEVGKPHNPQDIKPFWNIDEELEPAPGDENQPVQILISQRAALKWHEFAKAMARHTQGFGPEPELI